MYQFLAVRFAVNFVNNDQVNRVMQFFIFIENDETSVAQKRETQCLSSLSDCSFCCLVLFAKIF